MSKSRIDFKYKRIAEDDRQIEAHYPGAEIRYIKPFKSKAEIRGQRERPPDARDWTCRGPDYRATKPTAAATYCSPVRYTETPAEEEPPGASAAIAAFRRVGARRSLFTRLPSHRPFCRRSCDDDPQARRTEAIGGSADGDQKAV
jgi:hypothetical protein